MRRAHVLGLLLTCAASVALALPVHVNAATDMFYPRPIVPQNAPATACPAVAVSNIKVSVYDGALHTFEATISDPSYVAIAGSVGNTLVPFQFIQRIPAQGGGVAMRVHVQTTPIRGALPVSLTVLSAKPGQPVCVGVVLFTLTGSQGAGTGSAAGEGSSAAPLVKKPTARQDQGGTTSSVKPSQNSGKAGATETPATTTRATTTPAQGGLCTPASSFQLWLALIVLFAIATAVVALREPPLARQNRMLPVYLILGPLVILLLFWLFTASCRYSGWVPVFLIVIAAAGTLYAYSHNGTQRAILLLSEEDRANGQSGPKK